MKQRALLGIVGMLFGGLLSFGGENALIDPV